MRNFEELEQVHAIWKEWQPRSKGGWFWHYEGPYEMPKPVKGSIGQKKSATADELANTISRDPEAPNRFYLEVHR